jgi:carboxypeptidase T
MRGLGTRILQLVSLTGFLLLLVSGATAYTGEYPKMQVRLEWPTPAQLTTLRAMPDLDPMKMTPDREIILVSNPDQVKELEALGFKVEIMIPDMEEYYSARLAGNRDYGLFFTYTEMVAELDALHAQYPNLTTAKYSIGTSIEGRTLWAMKVSDNPNIDEGEPEVGFDGVHHAREPITVNVLLETIRYLCENYGVDPEITFLVNNREIYFVPIVNPDGYVYNEQTYPNGGGMWRKNRHLPIGGCYGVDLNRNYPYQWGGEGSSDQPCDETYRGTAPGSEIELSALMNYINQRQFVTYDTFHSVAGQVLFAWSYTTAHTPDDAKLRAIAQTLAGMAGYQYGQPPEILYVCAGTSMDWLYGEQQSKPKIYGFSTEVGGSDFWPTQAEVPGLVAENIPKNLYLIKVAGGYPALTAATLSGGDGDGLPDPGETLSLVATLQNQSVLKPALGVAVTLMTDDPYVQLNDASASIGDIVAGGSGSNAGDPFSFTVDPSCPAGHTLAITVRVTATNFDVPFDFEWAVGELPAIFADNMESGQGGWTHAAVGSGWADQWHMSTLRNHSPSGTTSWKFGATAAGGTYSNHADGALTTPEVAIGAAAELRFWHWMDAEQSSSYPGRAYDGGLIEMSLNGGAWTQVTPVAGYTHTIRTGSQPGPFAESTPVFSGTFDWREDTIVINGTPGNVRFRFRFGSDGVTGREGWYVDDVALVDMSSTNAAPGAPLLVSPVDGSTVDTATPPLVVSNATDPDPGDALTYGFRVYGDALQTQLVAEVTGVAEGTGTTTWMVTPALDNGVYYWRAFADDGTERGPCMAAAQFRVTAGGASVAETLPSGLRLIGPVPNPAPGATALRFELSRAARVSGGIYDAQGRLVRSLAGRFTQGAQSLVWDGRDAGGRLVPGGVYLYRLEAGDARREGRVLIVR